MLNNQKGILVVEDDASIRNLITTTLQANAYHYEAAVDGKGALLLATAKKIDMMLLDLGLPDMDGVEVIRQFAHFP